MAKDKSLSANPVHDFHKKAKKATINKSRAEKAKQRDVRLQQRRPDQMQRQVDELRELSKAGQINHHDKGLLEGLERDLARLTKLRAEGKVGPQIVSDRTNARDEHAPQRKKKTKIPNHPERSYYYDPIYNPYGVPPPGMEYRERESDSGSDTSTTSSVARIPMPEGSPPPRALIGRNPTSESAARGPGRMFDEEIAEDADSKDATNVQNLPPAQTTYSSEPVLRDLKQEASTFIPANLKRKHGKVVDRKQVDPLDFEAVEEQMEQMRQDEHVPATSRRRLMIAPDVK